MFVNSPGFANPAHMFMHRVELTDRDNRCGFHVRHTPSTCVVLRRDRVLHLYTVGQIGWFFFALFYNRGKIPVVLRYTLHGLRSSDLRPTNGVPEISRQSRQCPFRMARQRLYTHDSCW